MNFMSFDWFPRLCEWLLRTLSLCARHVSFAPVCYVAGDVSFCIVTCRGVQSMSAMSAKTFFVGQLSCMVEVDLVFVSSSDWFAKWSFDARVVCGCNSSVAG